MSSNGLKRCIEKSIVSIKGKGFIPAKYVESAEEMINPERGYYQIHTFKLGEDVSVKDREYTLNKTDTLAFVLIDISAYRDRELDEAAIADLEKIFGFFRDYRLDMIVRVVYDTVGRCMETEPEEESVVTTHMNQLGPILAKYSGEIYVYQGLLIGNWGEMHSSKFLSPARLKRLADVLLEEVKDTAFLAVRRPAYVRILFPEGEDVRQSRVGLFDDAIMASPTHMGTFGNKTQSEARRDQSWTPDEELEYVTELCDRVPYGGEALWTEESDSLSQERGSLKNMSAYFQKLHLSYLNRVHDQRFIDRLKELTWTEKDAYKGLNGYDYIGRHLGYRLVLRDVKCRPLSDEGDMLLWNITVENVGFSRAFFESAAILRGLDENGNEKEIDISDWMQLNAVPAGEKHVFNIHAPKLYGDIYLYATKKATRRAVYFANVNMNDSGREAEFLLGTVK